MPEKMSLLEFMESEEGGAAPPLEPNVLPSVADRTFGSSASNVPLSAAPNGQTAFVPGQVPPPSFPLSGDRADKGPEPGSFTEAQRKVGGPLGLRVELGMARGERMKRRILDTFGSRNYPPGFIGWQIGERGQPQIWHQHPEHGGMWIDINEQGMTFGDFADKAGIGIETLSQAVAVMALASTPGGAAFGLTGAALKKEGFKKLWGETLKFGAVLSAVGQGVGLGGAAAAGLSRETPFGFTSAEFGEEALRRGVEGVGETVIGNALDMLGLAARVAKDEAKKRAISMAMDELRKKRDVTGLTSAMAKQRWKDAQRLSRITNGKHPPELFLSIGQELGIPSLQRAEAATAKVPGAGTKGLEELQKEAMRSVEEYLTRGPGDAGKVGESIIRMLETIDDEMFDSAERLRKLAIKKGTLAATQDIALRLGPRPSHKLFLTDLGRRTRAAIVSKRSEFLARMKQGYDALRRLPGGSERIVDTEGVRTVGVKLQAKFGGSLDPSISDFLDRFNKEQAFLTIDQARKYRNDLWDKFNLNQAIPDADDFAISQVWTALNEAIDNSTKNAKHLELREGLRVMNKAYRKGVRPFHQKGIKEVFAVSGRGSAALDDDSLTKRWMEKPDQLGRVRAMLGDDSAEWAVFRRGIWDWAIRTKREPWDPSGRYVSAQPLNHWFSNVLDEKSRQILFGKEAGEIKRVLKLIAAGRKYLDLEDVANMKGSIAETLREAARMEQKRKVAFESRFFKPFIKGQVGPEVIQPEEFIRHMMTQGRPEDIGKMMRLLERDSPSKFFAIRRKAIADIIQESSGQLTANDMAKTMIGRQGSRIDGSKLWSNLVNKYGVDEATARRRLEAIIGRTNYNDLRAAAVVSAAQKGQDEGFQVAFGLMGGSIYANLWRGLSRLGTTKKSRRQLSSAASDMITFRVIGSLLASPEFRKIVRSGSEVSGEALESMISKKALSAADMAKRELPESTSNFIRSGLKAGRGTLAAGKGIAKTAAFPFAASRSRAVIFRALANNEAIIQSVMDEFKDDPEAKSQVQIMLHKMREGDEGFSLEEFMEDAQDLHAAGEL